MKKFIIFTVLAAACGDDAVERLTWGDAQKAWSEAWCGYAERCYPQEVITEYGSECVQIVHASNCENPRISCDELYPPDNEVLLSICATKMDMLPCASRFVPAACAAAFE